MIDFPASPTVGQLYAASNGVTYQWNGTIWVTSNAGGTGQVEAGNGTMTPNTGVDVVIAGYTVLSGNTGNWLNTTTGRYTPPAGSYYLQCTFGCQAPIGGNGTWGLVPRKNGVRIPGTGANASGSAQFSIPITVGVYVDANGTDFFDFVANCASAGMAAQGGQFTSFPLTGMQGPVGPIGQSSGDFWSYNSANIVGLTSGAVNPIKTDTVGNGNSGGWYNSATGRYTPPAGRYHIYATCTAGASVGALQFDFYLRKNGVNIPGARSGETPANTNYYDTAKLGVTVDANGTDYFDLTINPNASGTSLYVLNFGAFSTNVGPQGPTGQAGAFGTGFRTISNQTLGTAQASMDVTTLPADINQLQINFDLVATVNDVDCILQFYDAGGLLVTTGYLWSTTLNWSTAATAGSPQQTTSTSVGLSNGIYMDFAASGGRVNSSAGNSIAGSIFIRNILDTAKTKQANFNASYIAGNAAYLSGINGNGSRNAPGKITGFRVSFNGGSNVGIGSNLTVWGSP